MNEYRISKMNLYLFFGDLEKCFDKLCLKDFILKLSKTNTASNEIK